MTWLYICKRYAEFGIFNIQSSEYEFRLWLPMPQYPHKKISEVLPLHNDIIVVLSNK